MVLRIQTGFMQGYILTLYYFFDLLRLLPLWEGRNDLGHGNCTQNLCLASCSRITSDGAQGSYVVSEIKPGQCMCKVNPLLAQLSLQPSK